MKNVWIKYKWIFLILINALPFAADVLFFATGKTDNLFLFLPIFVGLSILNYQNCKKTISYILYQAFMLACIICAGYASTYLYYHNISNDSMTPIVGELFVYLESITNTVATVITAVIKAIKNKRLQNNNC